MLHEITKVIKEALILQPGGIDLTTPEDYFPLVCSGLSLQFHGNGSDPNRSARKLQRPRIFIT